MVEEFRSSRLILWLLGLRPLPFIILRCRNGCFQFPVLTLGKDQLDLRSCCLGYQPEDHLVQLRLRLREAFWNEGYVLKVALQAEYLYIRLPEQYEFTQAQAL